jgi:hypothetical protein
MVPHVAACWLQLLGASATTSWQGSPVNPHALLAKLKIQKAFLRHNISVGAAQGV